MRTFLINFQRQFALDVERGVKRQTIRANRKDGKRPAPGDELRLYTGLRTINSRWLRDGKVTACSGVRMHFDVMGGSDVVLNGRLLNHDERTALAQRDGFASWAAMRQWFSDQYPASVENGVWEGFCVEWE